MRRAGDRGSAARPVALRPVHRGLNLRRIAIADLLASPGRLAELRATLSAGGLAVVPTETFYGLAADPWSEAGVRRIFEWKGREASKALPVLFGERRQLAALGVAAAEETLDRFFAIWPAPLTVVLPLRAAIPASGGVLTLAVRMPAHDGLRALLSRVGPMTGTSLNRSGGEPCETADAAAALGTGAIDLLVDGGQTPGGLPSTLLDATISPPRVLRAGAFAWPPAPA